MKNEVVFNKVIESSLLVFKLVKACDKLKVFKEKLGLEMS